MTETVKANQDDTKKDSSEPPSSPKTKSKAVKQPNDGNERPKATDKAEKPPTKVVVRRLPPTMTLETFLDQVSPLPPVDYMYFVKADASLAPNSFARAYLHFVHVSDLLIFTEKFDNYVFVDSKGNEYPAVVEYAPFQRIPKQRSSRKKDPRIGTIGNDPYYLEFIEALTAEEIQRKSASKTNKQHFFETSTIGTAAPKVTSTPLLEFLKARRADKLKTKEDKIAERRKREIERRKARDDTRTSVKQVKTSEAESDIASSLIPQIKPSQPSSDRTPDLAEIQTRYLRCMIGLDTDTSGLEQIAGHGAAADKASKDAPDSKRSRDGGVKEIMSKRRDDDRSKAREKDKERKDKDTRDPQRGQKRDVWRDSVKDQVPVHDREKDKENQPATIESKFKETRRGGKSYQEERQRLNERRLAAKGVTPKATTSTDGTNRPDKGEGTSSDDFQSDKKAGIQKDLDSTSESQSKPHDKFRSSDQYRQQGNREGRKFEKPNRTAREPEQRRRNTEDRYHDDGKELRKNTHSDTKLEEPTKSHSFKEEARKKSYNQEREQRRSAADRKSQNKRDADSTDNAKKCPDDNKPYKERRTSLDNSSHKNGGNSQDEPSRSKSLADIKSLQASSSVESSKEKKKEGSDSRGDEKDKRDPRAERRIRNKDRPSIEIYRPGMGRFSKQRIEREKVLNKGSSTERDSPSSSPSPVPSATKTPVISENANE